MTTITTITTDLNRKATKQLNQAVKNIESKKNRTGWQLTFPLATIISYCSFALKFSRDKVAVLKAVEKIREMADYLERYANEDLC